MTDIGEAVKVSMLGQLQDCPFQKDPLPEDPTEEDEDLPYDDRITMATAPANCADKLGRSVKKGTFGTKGTWNSLGGHPERYTSKQIDTGRTSGKVKVKVRNRLYPFTVAAHHLIPGNASLYESDLFKKYMKRGGKWEGETPDGDITFEVSHNIGYNVNGCHNGVWLPGSYAMTAKINPGKVKWEILNSTEDGGDIDFCYAYMAAVTKKTGGQFHDTHTDYNTNAKDVLEKQTAKLQKHQVKCKHCRGNKKLPPPYEIKAKLYRLSKYLRGHCQRGPRRYNKTWMTSQQVIDDIFGNPAAKKGFIAAWKAAPR